MITLLAQLVLKPEGRSETALRRGYGVLCGGVGIALNLLLFLAKLLAGLASGSIAVVADAVNNLSDAASSFVTLAGFLLFRAGQARALAERGYEALGGEVFALFLPVLYGMVSRIVRDTLNAKGKEGTWW